MWRSSVIWRSEAQHNFCKAERGCAASQHPAHHLPHSLSVSLPFKFARSPGFGPHRCQISARLRVASSPPKGFWGMVAARLRMRSLCCPKQHGGGLEPLDSLDADIGIRSPLSMSLSFVLRPAVALQTLQFHTLDSAALNTTGANPAPARQHSCGSFRD